MRRKTALQKKLKAGRAGKRAGKSIAQKLGIKKQKASQASARAKKPKSVHKAMRAQIDAQRRPVLAKLEAAVLPEKAKKPETVRTYIPGLDVLLYEGIPKGATVLVAGGPGSGKTILCLQMAHAAAERGEKCLYLSFEESEHRLREHMATFGWHPLTHENERNLVIRRVAPFEIGRAVDALLAKARGELLIDIEPVVLPERFKPDRIFIDSLTAIASTFIGAEESYRIYIEQLFRFFEKLGATTFLITETENIPTKYSPTGVEEFLADGVLVLYTIRRGKLRENAVEVLKMRGVDHRKYIVALRISNKGIEVFPEQEILVLPTFA